MFPHGGASGTKHSFMSLAHIMIGFTCSWSLCSRVQEQIRIVFSQLKNWRGEGVVFVSYSLLVTSSRGKRKDPRSGNAKKVKPNTIMSFVLVNKCVISVLRVLIQ